MRFRKNLQKKLRSQRGMTMAELLCAVAVLAILGGGVAFMTPATMQTYADVTSGSEAAVLCSTLYETLADELRYATGVTIVADNGLSNFYYDSARYGKRVRLRLAPATGSDPHRSIQLIEVDEAGQEIMNGREYTLLHKKAYTSDLTAGISIVYNYDGADDATKNFTLTIAIPEGSAQNTLENKAYESITVTPLNLS